jgi:hypothetical protein
MDYDPLNSMLDGTTKATVDPVMARQSANEAALFQKEQEEKKRLAAEAAAQEQQQVKQTAQQKEAESRNNIPGVAQELVTANIGAGLDFVEDVGRKFNQPWMEIPDEWEPANKTEWGKAARQIMGSIGPAVGAALLTRRGLSAVGARTALGSAPKWVKAIGFAGADAGAGVAVDSVTRYAEDDNLGGVLKENFPKVFGWIPDDLATLDSDSPDIKRRKNVLEGAGLGLLVDVFQGGVDLARAIKGKMIRTEFIPKDTQAAKNLQELGNKVGTNFSSHPTIDRIIRNGELREKDVEQMAVKRFEAKGLNEPDPFIHSPIYDDAEKLPKAVEPSGVMNAMVDTVRIQQNVGTTNGRIASFVTNPALDGLGMSDVTSRKLVTEVEQRIKKAGNFEAKLPNGRMMSHAELKQGGEKLLAQLLDPSMSGSDIAKMFDDFNLRDVKNLGGDINVNPINETAYKQAFNAVKELKSFYLNIDTARASAYLQASLGGEVSDTATAIRIMGDEQDITRAQEMIMDKLTTLWYENDLSSSIAGWALNNKKVWESVSKSNDAAAIKRYAKEAQVQITSKAKQKAAESSAFVQQLKTINQENPEYLKPLMYAYELSDGNVRSINALNKYMANVQGTWTKAFIDRQPEIPSIVTQGLMGVFYNLKLSALMTPIKAIANNTALLLMKPANVMLGAAVRGDMKTLHRGWVQYATHMDTTLKAGGQYMSDMFKRVAADPSLTQRADFVTRNKDYLMLSESYAVAEAAKGNHGPMMKHNFVDMINKINDHPWFRNSMNMMEAGDGFVKATIALAEARGQAFDQLLAEGKKITGEDVQRVSKEIYQKMFDADGLITDEAVSHASREISMNLDSSFVTSLNGWLNRAPILKTVIMFPRTSTNILEFIHKHSPLSYFIGDLEKVRTLKDVDEITQYLAGKGIPFSEQAWNTHKSEVLGRVAMGTATMTYGSMMFLSGNLTGNGNFDKQTSKFSQNVGERPLRSWKGPDGKWRSYDGIEPLASILALTADVLENHDTLGSGNAEQLLSKAMYAVSMNLTNKSFLTGIQPIMDMSAGNEVALSRYLSNLSSVGALGQFARLVNPGLREVDLDLANMLRNKWNVLDTINVGEPLPYMIDHIDGGIVGRENWFDNALNALLPFKTSSNPSPEKQFLIDSEYDAMPQLKASLGNVPYTARQRSRLAELMAQSGIVKKGIREMMKDPKYKKDLQMMEQARSQGLDSKELDLSNSMTHMRLRSLYNQATVLAKKQLAAETPDISKSEVKVKKIKGAQARGDWESILSNKNK